MNDFQAERKAGENPGAVATFRSLKLEGWGAQAALRGAEWGLGWALKPLALELSIR